MSTLANVKVTPIFGGRGDVDCICLLLELGNDARILLDCGAPANIDHISHSAISSMKNVDLILISHADNQHLGCLPLLQGKYGGLSEPIPMLCTLPVLKFGQMVLYDTFMNQEMEGRTTQSVNKSSLQFDLDDVDNAFKHVQTVKYCQQISLEKVLKNLKYSLIKENPSHSHIYFCGYCSGRTVGGTIWRIRYGNSDIVYAMDLNLRKEITLNGASVELLPPSPALLITEAGSLRRQHYTNPSLSNTSTNKKEKEDFNKVLSSIMITLRQGGNVLIPCEPAGRTLEYLQIFAKYWHDKKLGLYHLVFLSHMATNIFEYASSQLEWMNDNLSKDFYNGRPNPFDLKSLMLLHNIDDLEKNYPGPKVVFASDSSLSLGHSKELLLRWGQDPKNKVVLLDYSYEGSLASIIRNQLNTFPIVITVTRPQRVELVGKELEEYKKEKEKQKRLKDEAKQREMLLQELNLLNSERDCDLDEGDTDYEAGDESNSSKGNKRSNDEKAPALKRQKLQSEQIRRFTEPLFPMFQSQYKTYPINEYGVSNADLIFQDIAPAYLLQKRGPSSSNTLSNVNGRGPANGTATVVRPVGLDPTIESTIPHKIQAIKVKIELTCQFFESHPISGRCDGKAIQGMISKINPSKLIVIKVSDILSPPWTTLLHKDILNSKGNIPSKHGTFIFLNMYNVIGRDADCDRITKFGNEIGVSAVTLASNSSNQYSFTADRLKIQIVQSLLPSMMKSIRPFSISSSQQPGLTSYGSASDGSVVCPITGMIEENVLESGRDGIRVVRLLANSQKDDEQTVEIITDATEKGDNSENMAIQGDNMPTEDETKETQSLVCPEEAMDQPDDIEAYLNVDKYSMISSDPISHQERANASAISVGEIMLNNLKQILEQSYGLQVEFRVSKDGGMLVCNSSVIIRKKNDNDFVVEGSPSATYYTVRKALYNQIAFI